MPKKGYWERKLEDPEYKALQRIWDEKLRQTGFVDIEQRLQCGGQEGQYLTGSPSSGDLCRGLYKAETEEYFSLARKHLHTMKWRSSRDTGRRTVWRLHSEGVPAAQIVRLVGDRLGFGVKRVRSIIREEQARIQARLVRQR